MDQSFMVIETSQIRIWAFLPVAMILLAGIASTQDAPPFCCGSGSSQPIVCLTEFQMPARVKHVEMQPDRMGHHVNLSGLTVFDLLIGKNGRVLNARAVSGPPLALPLLMASIKKWRFKPLKRDGEAQQVCGRLVLRVSMNENQPKIELAR